MSGFQSARQKHFAKALRSNMTEEEKRLWYHLRAHRLLGLSVRRQAPVGPFIVDFLIPSRRLVIEADGAHHDPASDTIRDAQLSALGYRTLRLTNHDIRTNLPGVLARIAEEAQR